MIRYLKKWLPTFYVLLVSIWSFGQTELPDTSLARPYDAVYTHLYYLQPKTYEPELAALSVYGFGDSKEACSAAIKIKQVLDGKGLFVRLDLIPKDSSHLDSLGNSAYILFPKKLPEVSLEKIGNKWYYSRETINNLDKVHARVYPYGSNLMLNILPRFGEKQLFGMEIWKYLGLLVLMATSFIFYKVLSWIFVFAVRLTTAKRVKEFMDPKVFWGIAHILSLVIIVHFLKKFTPALLLPIRISKCLTIGLEVIWIIFVTMLVVRVFSFIMEYSGHLAERTESKLDDQILPVIRRLVKAGIVIIGCISVLRALEINITALIAGVSIGGLALALAAQDTVRNLFGSFMIFWDKPFQIGDFVVIGDAEGVVEEVGIRSTRLRAADTSLHSVPNGTVANMMIKNLGVRTMRRYRVEIGITYDTPPLLIEKFIEGILGIAENHPKSKADSWEVRLHNFADSSINILINGYFDVTSGGEELQARHDLMIAMIKLAELLGVRFAFPSSTVYIEDFPGKISNVQGYNTKAKDVDGKLAEFMEDYKRGFTEPKT